jgi:signal transduction histidine kinase
MKGKIVKIYSAIANSGIDESDPQEKRYRQRSINKFCLSCILISSPYLPVFYLIDFKAPFYTFVVAHLLFSFVIYLNYKKRFNEGRLLLLSTTAFSVLLISYMLGFESGFHLYLYTAPLFVFWLFDTNEIKNIVLSFIIYSIVYGTIFIFKNYYVPVYDFNFHLIGLDLYSINMILNLVLLFLLFYNYSTYYKLLALTLVQKQEILKVEIEKRNQSEENIKKLFSELTNSYNSLEQFSFIVSHNLKSPLANIKGFLGLYDKEGKDLGANKKIIEYIETAAGNLDGVLTDLNYILKSKKQLMERKEDIQLIEAVNNVKISLSLEIENSAVEIREEYKNEINLYTIKTVLHSILYNLIQNAIKYKREGVAPFVKIEAARNKNETVIRVSDNGIGIDLHKYHDRIFNLYNRFNYTIEGKGIGLYLVKNQIEMLGGSIEVESDLNKGTTFVVKLNN